MENSKIVMQHRNIENCCRTCLNDLSNKMYDLFSHKDNSVTAAEMLRTCVLVKVRKRQYIFFFLQHIIDNFVHTHGLNHD